MVEYVEGAKTLREIQVIILDKILKSYMYVDVYSAQEFLLDIFSILVSLNITSLIVI